ncbi:hypothetical protein SRABI128_05321 [Microbacterium sp. Bi128]|nr:hypothetical protein SRABI128_05321 [Microbacterium sp. Bi128]
MPWLEEMATTQYGTPSRAVSASTSGTARETVSSHIAADATRSSTTPAISTRRTPNRSIARTANGVPTTEIAASGSISRPTTPGL